LIGIISRGIPEGTPTLVVFANGAAHLLRLIVGTSVAGTTVRQTSGRKGESSKGKKSFTD